MRRILITLIAMLMFSAAAQNIEYASLWFTLDDGGRPEQVHISLQNEVFNAFNLTRVAREAFRDDEISTPSLGSFLTFMATRDWRVTGTFTNGPWVYIILERELEWPH